MPATISSAPPRGAQSAGATGHRAGQGLRRRPRPLDPSLAFDTDHSDTSVPAQDVLALQDCEDIAAHLPAIPRNVGHLCPISLEPVGDLTDAVLAEDLLIYDRNALVACMTLSPLSPMTRQPMFGTHQSVLGPALSARLCDAGGFAHLRRAHIENPEMMAQVVQRFEQLAWQPQPERQSLAQAYYKLVMISIVLGLNLENLYTLFLRPHDASQIRWLPTFMRNDYGYGVVLSMFLGVEIRQFAAQLQTIAALHREQPAQR